MKNKIIATIPMLFALFIFDACAQEKKEIKNASVIADDGHPPTGKRYCMNSIAFDFIPDNKTAK